MLQLNRKRIAVNTFLLYGKTLITLIISLFSTRLVLAALGEVDYGVYGVVGGSIAMLSVLNLAMARATQRYINYAEGGDSRQRLLSIFNNTLLLHMGLAVVIVILMAAFYYPLFHGIFSIPDNRITAAKIIYLFLAVSTFFSIISVPYDALINAHEDFLYYSIVGIVISVLNLVSAIIVTQYMKDRLILYGLLMTIIALINLLIMFIYCRVKYDECRFEPRHYANYAVMKEVGVFSGWNFVGGFAQMAGNHGSNLLMNHFFGSAIIAAKNIGDQISTQVAVLSSNLTKAITPAIVKSEGGGYRGMMIDLSYKSSRFGVLLYLVLAIPFLLNSEPLLGLWLKSIPEWAVLFCQLQVFRVLMEQLFASLSTILLAEGSIKQMNVIDLLLGILTFLIIWLLYSLGFDARWHYFVSIGILVVISGLTKLYLCHRICHIRMWDFMRDVVSYCVLAALLSWTICALINHMMNNLHVLIVVSIQVIVIFVIELLVGLSREERDLLFSSMKRLVFRKGK